MSLDLFIYTKSQTPISHASLHGRMRKARWQLLVMHGRMEIESAENALKLGVIYDVYGVKEAALLNGVRVALKKGSHQSLEKLYKTGKLNSVYLTVDVIEDPSEISAGGKYADDLRAAKLHYVINGHGAKLQFALWETLGQVTGGLMDDPQTGEIRRGGPVTRRKPSPRGRVTK